MGACPVKGRRGFTYTELLCVTAIIAIVWGALVPALARARGRADEASCAVRLRNIAWGLRIYSQDHSGRLPAEITALTPRYLDDAGVFRCPSAELREKRHPRLFPASPPDTVDFTYRAGLAIDDHPSVAAAWDNGPRHRGGNVAYLSGRVQRVDPVTLAALATGGEVSP